ncbi:putative peroxiredoxin bcp [Thalassoglobus neptunius]|uniref:thioredoxin-dependent peroxiredoxin n=1 Tax=Thalassoglobus neptunius TaxID=1938619 RepID=A0A5C5X6S0_9PLAN|nr:peroxiredoxin [Thalassoglobus neptunius]TWT58736.1 putative peroxiredoxin bcp [Thalassoglobus neptunius]
MKTLLLAATTATFLLSSTFANAVDVTLNVGDQAPSFVIQDDTGANWNSDKHFANKTVVVYFYPADMTGGCTKQACGFRDDLSKLEGENVEVVGVSGDSVRNHQLFKKAHDLNFTLLADPDGVAATAFGVPFTKGEKSITREIDGKEEVLTRGGTAKRWTFVVKNGKVVYKDDKVNAAEDSQKILAAIEGLKK